MTDEEVDAIMHADHVGEEFLPELDSAKKVLAVQRARELGLFGKSSLAHRPHVS